MKIELEGTESFLVVFGVPLLSAVIAVVPMMLILWAMPDKTMAVTMPSECVKITNNIPDIKIPEIKIPAVNIPNIKIPAPVVRESITEVNKDVYLLVGKRLDPETKKTVDISKPVIHNKEVVEQKKEDPFGEKLPSPRGEEKNHEEK